MKIEASIKMDSVFEISITLNSVDPDFDIENFMEALKESVMMQWNSNKDGN